MSTFLGLPLEVRRSVYQYHFSGVRMSYQHRKTPRSTWSDDSCVRIFIVCKQTIEESQPIFFEEARINLRNFINLLYGSFSCPVTNPKLIKHAYIDIGSLYREGTFFDCDNFSRVVAAMPNLNSLVLRILDAQYGFEGGVFENGNLHAAQKTFITQMPGRMIGKDEEHLEFPDWDDKVIRSVINA